MSAHPAITVEHVTKRFRLIHDRHGTLKGTVLNGFRRTTYDEFLALDDVSLEVPEGSTYGFIGENGSGKSTLLKCMAKIYRADKGHIDVRGKVSALLELGAGFHPELSGRENVYLNASILGMSRRDVDGCFDDIVEFSGLERFIDTPVKNYSSGMYVRLGFAVAINVDPEVLLVDEILAVGDEAFQTRCTEKFADLKRSGSTIVVVSHGLDQMRNLCDRIAWFEHGVLQAEGPSGQVVDQYLKQVRSDRTAYAARTRDGAIEAGDTPIISRIEALDGDGRPSELLRTGAPAAFRVTFDEGRIGEPVAVAIGLFRVDGTHVMSCNTGGAIVDGTGSAQRSVTLSVPALPIITGRYALSVALHDANLMHVHERADRTVQFEIEPDPAVSYPQRGIAALGGTWSAS